MKELKLHRRYKFREVKSTVIGDPKKNWSGIEVQGTLNKKRWRWRLAWWGSTEKKDASQIFGLTGKHQCSDQHSRRIRAPRVASNAAGPRGGGPVDQVVSINRTADGRRQRSW